MSVDAASVGGKSEEGAYDGEVDPTEPPIRPETVEDLLAIDTTAVGQAWGHKWQLAERVITKLGRMRYHRRLLASDLRLLRINAGGDLTGYFTVGENSTVAYNTSRTLLHVFKQWSANPLFKKAVTMAKCAAADTEKLRQLLKAARQGKGDHAKSQARWLEQRLAPREHPLTCPNVLYMLVLRVQIGGEWVYRAFVGRAGVGGVNTRFKTHIAHANRAATGDHWLTKVQHVALVDAMLPLAGCQSVFVFIVKYCTSRTVVRDSVDLIGTLDAQSLTSLHYLNVRPAEVAVGYSEACRDELVRLKHQEGGRRNKRCDIKGVVATTGEVCKKCANRCKSCKDWGSGKPGHCCCKVK